MKNNITELVFILDRSGSMAGLESDTIGGFNGMLSRQRGQDGRCYVSTVLFDDRSFVLHDRLPLERVAPLTDRDYTVGGCTALLDALGGAIRHISDIHRYARPEDVPEHTLFVVITDGMENASCRYRAEQVKAMVRARQERGWEFLFLGANIDAVETARHYGIRPDRAVNYHADEQGTRVAYDTVAAAVCQMRSSAPLEADWCDSIRQDFSSRKSRR